MFARLQAYQMDEKIRQFRRFLDYTNLSVSLLCSLGIVFQIGYNSNILIEQFANRLLEFCFLFFAGSLFIKTATAFFSKSSKISRISEALVLLYFLSVAIADNYYFSGADGTQIVKPEWMYLGRANAFRI